MSALCDDWYWTALENSFNYFAETSTAEQQYEIVWITHSLRIKHTASIVYNTIRKCARYKRQTIKMDRGRAREKQNNTETCISPMVACVYLILLLLLAFKDWCKLGNMVRIMVMRQSEQANKRSRLPLRVHSWSIVVCRPLRCYSVRTHSKLSFYFIFNLKLSRNRKWYAYAIPATQLQSV